MIEAGMILSQTFDHNANLRKFWKVLKVTAKRATIAPMDYVKSQGRNWGEEIYKPVEGSERAEEKISRALDTLAGRPTVRLSARNWLEVWNG